jgi:hypothetical protein
MAQAAQKKDSLGDYVQVNERIIEFYDAFPNGRVITEILEHDAERGFILMKAFIYRNAEDEKPSATGHAYELKSEGYVQRTSYVEVCETSVVGRALGNFFFSAKRSLAARRAIKPVGAKVVEAQPVGGIHYEREKLTARIAEATQSLRANHHPEIVDGVSRLAFVKRALVERGADSDEVNGYAKLTDMDDDLLTTTADILEGEVEAWKERQAEAAANVPDDDTI